MIHSNIKASHFIGGYCLAIKYLINNPTEEGRGAKVFDKTMEYSKRSHIDPMFNEWLVEAKNLIGQENTHGFITLDKYNPQPKMGFLKHALILAFYCLLRVEQDYSKDLTKGFDFAQR